MDASRHCARLLAFLQLLGSDPKMPQSFRDEIAGSDTLKAAMDFLYPPQTTPMWGPGSYHEASCRALDRWAANAPDDELEQALEASR